MRTATASTDSVLVVKVQVPRLRAIRQRAGFSLRGLEKISEVPFRRIWEAERGMYLAMPQARAIAGALRVPMSKLT